MNSKNKLYLLSCLLTTQIQNSKSILQRTTRSLNVSGEWDTDWGKLILNQTGDTVTGTYEWDTGQIKGILVGNTLKGLWSEAPTYECPNDKGAIELEFSPDATTLNGKWGYCNQALTGTWIGTKAISNKGTNIMGIDVTGSWKMYDGILLLKQGGNRVEGNYEGINFISGANEGKILGIISQDLATKLFIFTGTWTKPPTFTCPDDAGTLKMIFNNVQDQFEGNWGYCNTLPLEQNAFQGNLIAGPTPLVIAGTWDTNIGPMTFTQYGSLVTGTYKHGKGKLSGLIIGNVLIGNWSEADSYSCPYNKGKYKMIFSPDATTFKSIWGYCEAEPDPSNIWEGIKS